MKFAIFMMSFAISSQVFASNEASQTFTLDGQLFLVGTTSPLIDGAIQIKIQILDPSETCVLYEETQTVNTTSTEGYFTIQVGSVVGSSKRSGLDPGQSMANIIQNVAAISAASVPAQTCAASAYNPAPGDLRYFRISVTPSGGPVDILTPDMVLDSVPSAIVAQSIEGLDRTSILHTNTTAPAGEALTQANLESLFTPTAFANLTQVLQGNFVATAGAQSSTSGFTFNSNSDSSGADGGFNFQSGGTNLITISNTGAFNVTAATNSTSVSTGAVTVGGGIGAAGNIFSGGVLSSSDGTSALPSHTFTSNLSSGMYTPSAGALGFSSNGTERLRIDNTGKVGIGTTSPGVSMDVAGGIRAGSSTAVTACGLGASNGEGTQRYNYTSHAMEYCNGTTWVGLGAALGPSSVGANGYQQFPNGLIIQWGQGGTANAPVTFPIPFPNNVFSIVATEYTSGTDTTIYGMIIVTKSLTGFSPDVSAGNGSKFPYSWIAIGN